MINKNSIYASYGIIMKEFQNTELLLTQAIYSINLKRGKIKSEEKVEKVYSNCLSDYFSHLVKKLKDLSPESDLLLYQEDSKKIEDMVKLRNNFAHSFFKEYQSFDNQKLIQEIYEGNKFIFNLTINFNITLQDRLRIFLKTMNYKMNEIENIVTLTSEDWESIINHQQ